MLHVVKGGTKDSLHLVSSRCSRTRHEFRREGEVRLVLVLLSANRIRDPQAQADESAGCGDHDSQLLRLGCAGLDVLLRHGEHLKLLGLQGENRECQRNVLVFSRLL